MQLVLTESKKIAQQFEKAGYKAFSAFYKNEEGYTNPTLRCVAFKKTSEGYNLHFEINLTALTGKKWDNDTNIWGHCFRHVSHDNPMYKRIKEWIDTSIFTKKRVDLKKGGAFGHVVANFIYVEIEDKSTRKNKDGYQFYQVNKLSFPKEAKFTWKKSGYAPEIETVEGIEDLIEQA